MVYSVPVTLVNPGEQSFLPNAFGGSAQVILNTTSFSDVLGQLGTVSQISKTQHDGGSPAPLTLMLTGCYVNASSESAVDGAGTRAGSGYRDCTTACSDVSMMFNSSYTLWNCLTLAAASQYVDDQVLILDSDELATAGDSMGFSDLGQFNATSIFSNTLQCIQSSCQDYSLGSCTKNITTLDISRVSDQVSALYNGLQTYCDGMDSAINSDIAGPGVVLSYILQAVLAITVYVFINLLTSWLRPILSFLYTVQDRIQGQQRSDRAIDATAADLHPQQQRNPWQRAGEHQRNLSRSRAAAALTSALVEFQEMQGFFVASIQLATLMIFASSDHSAMLSSTSSFAEAVMNVEIVQMLSISGVLPVLFTQVGLMRLGVRWWYLTCIMVIVFSTAIIISQKSLMPDYNTLWSYFTEESPIAMCGGNPSPMTYCLDSLNVIDQAVSSMNSGLFVGFIVAPALVADQAWHSLDRNGRMTALLDKWELSSATALMLRRRVWPLFRTVAWFGLEFALLIYVGMYLKSVIDILQFVGTSASDWTFGQLIAIMVWAPVIGKYVYYNAFGITEGVGRRLPKRYKVVEVDEDEDDSGSGPRLTTLDAAEEEEWTKHRMGPRKYTFGSTKSSRESFQLSSRKSTFQTLSREDTLVGTFTPNIPGTPYIDSPYDVCGRKNNPFDDLGRGKLDKS
ncbi:hypothetical protein M406DRAFT_328223 [Cryphonectria parasitica EP155]|uniref:Uncharacterized protein n=1 Tax=Cryphonectria parasitica (strain ATCC 38755 / EP155) TaxID=660469 RepID=A0A9P4Y5W4_CRYP1|nr:uncharacterized protein M406DRAFT_328223 [Cryphonectria parasitica EP155]KAF3767123.1 hypothetical protein M406DRAFT_328223 [Cryphonectria parasitica EP155]